MSTVVPKGHRHTRSVVMPPATTSSQNPQSPHHLNLQAHALNAQSKMNKSTHPSTPPQTPQKPSSQNKATSNAQETGSKQKPRIKRPKNVTTSPAVTRNDRNTPPLTGLPSSAKPMSTPSTAAYAGPTFHASPAPSALPIPSFYSKSVPESPGLKGIKSMRETPLSDSPTPAAVSSNAPFHREESPLDVFFKADREEKARARSASSTQKSSAATGPFQPPSVSPRTSQTPPALTSQDRPRRTNRTSSSGMFTMELDGPASPGAPYGPAFSTPYSERISAARPSNPSPQAPSQNAQRTAKSEALKAYLFSDSQTSTASPSLAHQYKANEIAASVPAVYRNSAAVPRSQTNNYSFSQDQKASGRSSGLRQEVTPTRTPTKPHDLSTNYSPSPTPSRIYRPSGTSDLIGRFPQLSASPSLNSSNGVSPSENRSSDLKGMEDSLRKMLKLDSAGTSGTSATGDLPAASISVPNYIGGRPPPN